MQTFTTIIGVTTSIKTYNIDCYLKMNASVKRFKTKTNYRTFVLPTSSRFKSFSENFSYKENKNEYLTPISSTATRNEHKRKLITTEEEISFVQGLRVENNYKCETSYSFCESNDSDSESDFFVSGSSTKNKMASQMNLLLSNHVNSSDTSSDGLDYDIRKENVLPFSIDNEINYANHNDNEIPTDQPENDLFTINNDLISSKPNETELFFQSPKLSNLFEIFTEETQSTSSQSSVYDQDSKFTEALGEITLTLFDRYKNDDNGSRFNCSPEKRQQRRQELMVFIEDIMLNIVETRAAGENPKLVFRNQKKWNNCFFDDKLSLKPPIEATMQEVKFSHSRSKSRFELLVYLLSKIYKLLQTQSTCTKRELYYQNISLVKNQRVIDEAIRDICNLLEAPSWELGVTATSKGLVAGALSMTLFDGRVVDCMIGGGVLVPQNTVDIQQFSSDAKYILVVEKDAIFQKLLDEGILKRLGPCILITGKGFPDINTRLLLKRLWLDLAIPILALVDADAYGIEIMCVYRFGSLAMSHQSNDLAVPSLRWLGVHPSDIVTLDIPRLPLTKEDQSRLNDLLNRPYTIDDSNIRDQIQILLDNNAKAEIEAVGTISTGFLTDIFLPNKICSRDLI